MHAKLNWGYRTTTNFTTFMYFYVQNDLILATLKTLSSKMIKKHSKGEKFSKSHSKCRITGANPIK